MSEEEKKEVIRITEPVIYKCEPASIKVEPGKIYSWCTCGLTATSPFCDSRHKLIEGLPFRSIKVMFDKEEEIRFCQCKQTKTPPFCDDSHLGLEHLGNES